MPLDLPPDSLGPKPTKKQMELLQRMATVSVTIHVWTGVTLGSGGAYIDYHRAEANVVKHDPVSRRDVAKFFDYGWIEHFGGDWKSQDYRVSDRGRKVIEKGVTR